MIYVERLYELWYSDSRARHRLQLLTVAIAFTYGVFNSLVLGRPEKRVTWEVLALIFLVTVGFSVVYCLRPREWKLRSVSLGEIFRNRTTLELALASVFVLVISSFAIQFPKV